MISAVPGPSGLMIKADAEGRAELAEARELGGYPRAWALVCESLYDRFVPIDPADVGALTDAPMLTDDLEIAEDGKRTVHGAVWAFMAYQVADPTEALQARGWVLFPEAT